MIDSIISTIQALPPNDCETLQEMDGPRGQLRVRQHGQYRWLQMSDTSIQSLMDTSAPARLVSPSSILMLMGLAFAQGRSRVLNLGLGGGAIERCLRSAFVDVDVDSVELDERVVAMARDHFFLPRDQTVHVQDAQRFMRRASGHYDAVLCDLFCADQPAACLGDHGFFADIARCLSPGGVCVVNLLHTDQHGLVSVLKAARTQLPATWLVEIKDHQNVIAYFMRERFHTDQELRRAGKRLVRTLDAVDVPFDWEVVSLPEPAAHG